MSQQLLNIIISCVSVILTGLASWGVGMFTKWLSTKIKDEKAAKVISDLTNITMNAVKQIYQQFVEVLKTEGKFDEVAQQEAKAAALDIIKNQLTKDMKEYFTANGQDIIAYINNLIESVLYSLKNNK